MSLLATLTDKRMFLVQTTHRAGLISLERDGASGTGNLPMVLWAKLTQIELVAFRDPVILREPRRPTASAMSLAEQISIGNIDSSLRSE